MSKEEFLRILRMKISGSMSPLEVESQVDYYRAYIEGEVMKGKSEEEVTQNLGDPSLIAKTLTSAMKRAQEEYSYQENNSEANEYNNNNYNQTNSKKSKVVQMGGAGCIAMLVIAVLIIILLVVLIIKFSFTIIGILWPVILVLVIAGLIFGLIRRR